MKKFILPALLAIWLPCGYYASGYSLGGFQNEFPDQCHGHFSDVWGYTGGPIALSVMWAADDFRHFSKRHFSRAERLKYFNQEAPELGESYFDHAYSHGCTAEELR